MTTLEVKNRSVQVSNSQLNELRSVVRTSQHQSFTETVANLASLSQESWRIADPNQALINQNGDILSLQGQNILDMLAKRRLDYSLGEQEYQSFAQLQDEVKIGLSDQWVWISPPEDGVYTESKVSFYYLEKQDQQKILSSWSIILDDFSYLDCLKLATDLNKYSQTPRLFTDSDSVRSQVVSIDVIDPDWRAIFQRLVPNDQMQKNIAMIESGEALEFKQKALELSAKVYREMQAQGLEVDSNQLFQKLDSIGLLGDYSSSCPTTIFGGLIRSNVLSEFRYKPGFCANPDCIQKGSVTNVWHKEDGGCGWCKGCEQMDNFKRGRI